jgi:hypothetical protein
MLLPWSEGKGLRPGHRGGRGAEGGKACRAICRGLCRIGGKRTIGTEMFNDARR